VDMRLTPEDAALAADARAFCDEVLVPLEDECEAHDGLTPESAAAAKQAVLDRGCNAINHAIEDGGRGYDVFQVMLIEEQWGRATGALWDIPWRPSIPLAAGTEAQKDRYLRPACAGARRDAYAITEEGAGSDVSMVATTARRDGDAWVIDGEKWHVTSGDVADFFLVHAHVDGDPAKATVFLVDKDTPGVRLVRTPKYMHTFVFEHPIYAFDGVRVGDDQVLGEVGQGFELTKDWFVEERIMIGARTVGAATRALELSTAFAADRRQFGSAIIDFQAVAFMLADMAAELMAAKSMLYRVCWDAARGGADRKRIHAEASAVKLVCSETAGRVIDEAVQIFGGRGYMRDQPVERLYRELRVDRIWEGTSEIQRVVIANELAKRGPGAYTGWPGSDG
jgi:acyl-CoA dehydrogenase